MPAHDVSSSRQADIAFFDHLRRNSARLLFGSARRQRQLTSVQPHVALLNAIGGQRADRSKILRQCDSGRDLRQLLRRSYSEYFQARLRAAMGPRRPADDAHSQGQLDLAAQIASVISRPGGQAPVAPLP